MSVSMINLALVSLYAAVLGIFIGAAYDIVRIIRVALGISSYGKRKFFSKIYSSGVKNIFSFKRSGIFDSIAVGAGDVVFFIFSAAAFSVFLYHFNFGRFRWFIFLFCLGGFLAYYFSIGMLVVRFSDAISQVVMLVVNLAVFLIILPFRMLFRISSKFYKKWIYPINLKIKNAVDKKRKKRYTYKCIKKIPEYIKFKV